MSRQELLSTSLLRVGGDLRFWSKQVHSKFNGCERKRIVRR